MNGVAQFGGSIKMLLVAGLFGTLPADLVADEFVELKIPLEDGRYFSLRGFCGECNRLLGTHYDLDSVGDRRFEITPKKRRVLQALAFALIDVLHCRCSLRTRCATALNPVVIHSSCGDQACSRRRLRQLVAEHAEHDGRRSEEVQNGFG